MMSGDYTSDSCIHCWSQFTARTYRGVIFAFVTTHPRCYRYTNQRQVLILYMAIGWLIDKP